MKKIVLTLLALIGMASLASAAATNTPTVTPNATLTAAQTQIQQTQTAVAATATYIQTAFPTLTPTLTPTGTLTPSATFTPSPKQLKGGTQGEIRTRIYFQPQQFTQADGTSSITNTVTAGNATAYLAQSLSQTVLVMESGAAEVRLGFTVPWDYKGDGRLFLYMNAQTIADSVTLTVGVNIQSFNCTTQTVGTFSYTPPRGGFWYMPGTATQVVAGYGGQIINPLWDTTLQVVSRVMMPLNAQAYAYWTNNPTVYPAIRHGDILNFDIKRTTGGLGNIYVYGAEYQYDYYNDQKP